MEQTIKIPKFSSERITDNVLWGLADYLNKYLLPPDYRPMKLDAQGNVVRDGGQNQVEVRVQWVGKARVIPFIVLSPNGNFKEIRSNFNADSTIDEYITSTGGVQTAWRDHGTFGTMGIRMTIVTDDAEKRIELSDYLMSKLTRSRKAFIYRDPDGLGSYMMSFTNDNMKIGELADPSLNNNTEFLHTVPIDILMFIEYHTIEQLFPGVMQNASFEVTIVGG
jgi:hypothetical protein